MNNLWPVSQILIIKCDKIAKIRLETRSQRWVGRHMQVGNKHVHIPTFKKEVLRFKGTVHPKIKNTHFPLPRELFINLDSGLDIKR